MNRPKPTITEILKGHDSQETAFLVDDYPYGFKLRCKIRYWLEHHPRHGTRLVSETTNPKRPAEYWNKPKASTYASIAGAMYLNENNHVTWSGLTEYSDAAEAEDWLNTFREGLPPQVLKKAEEWLRVKRVYKAALDAGKIEIKITLAEV